MSSAGRKRDPIWNCYTALPHVPGKLGCRAKCKDCGVELQGLVALMRNHKQTCTVILDDGDQVDPNKVSELSDTVQPGQSVSGSATSSAAIPMNIVPPSSSGMGNVNVNKKHESSDRRPEGTPSAKVQRLDGFLTKTTKSEKEVLD